MWPESHTYTLKGFWNVVPHFLLLYYGTHLRTKDAEVDWLSCSGLVYNEPSGQWPTWSRGIFTQKLNQSHDISGGSTAHTTAQRFKPQPLLFFVRLLYSNLNTQPRLERHLCLKVQSQRRRWRRQWAFIKVCENKQLMQTPDTPGRNFSPEGATMSAA